MRPPLLALLLSGCAWGPGTGFATLEHLTLVTEGPDDGVTDLGFDVAWETLILEVGDLALDELSGGATTFDPANPPPGFGLCHNGHCHAADGSLPTYAEIEAMLAGDQASWVPVVRARLPALDLLAPEPQDPGLLPSPLLPLAEIGRASLPLRSARLDATVTPPGGEPASLSLDLPLDAVLTGSVFLVVDRHAPPEVSVDVRLGVPGDWLDGLDLSLDPADLADPITQRLGALSLEAELR